MNATPIRVLDAETRRSRGEAILKSRVLAALCAGAVLATAAPSVAGGGGTGSRPTLQEMACRASAIVVGSVATGQSTVAPTGDLIFTEYVLVAEKTLKPHALARKLRVIRVGGEVEGDGRRSFRSRLLPPLEIGRRYLLFLAPIAGADSFAADIPGGTLLLTDSGRVAQVDGASFVAQLPAPGTEADYDAVIAAIRGAVEKGCPR